MYKTFDSVVVDRADCELKSSLCWPSITNDRSILMSGKIPFRQDFVVVLVNVPSLFIVEDFTGQSSSPWCWLRMFRTFDQHLMWFLNPFECPSHWLLQLMPTNQFVLIFNIIQQGLFLYFSKIVWVFSLTINISSSKSVHLAAFKTKKSMFFLPIERLKLLYNSPIPLHFSISFYDVKCVVKMDGMWVKYCTINKYSDPVSRPKTCTFSS